MLDYELIKGKDLIERIKVLLLWVDKERRDAIDKVQYIRGATKDSLWLGRAGALEQIQGSLIWDILLHSDESGKNETVNWLKNYFFLK